jgi:hypothetical protein
MESNHIGYESPGLDQIAFRALSETAEERDPSSQTHWTHVWAKFLNGPEAPEVLGQRGAFEHEEVASRFARQLRHLPATSPPTSLESAQFASSRLVETTVFVASLAQRE